MMIFPITNLLDENQCYDYLLRVLRPDGLKCPEGHTLEEDQSPHMTDRVPIVDYRCRSCEKVFNIFTGTMWQGTHCNCRTIILLIRGFAQGTPSLHLAKELKLNYESVLNRRHLWQELARQKKTVTPLSDLKTESDEMFQNAGEKGEKHNDPDDPPRVRANNRRGLGTMNNDRPPIHGVVGRESGQIRLEVCDNTQQKTIQPNVERSTDKDATVYTDESNAYNHVGETGRTHHTVCHSQKEYARDDDGDGKCEVHCNTMEGIWTGVRNFLRPFRGVHKKYLAQYVAIFEWAHNLKSVTEGFLCLVMT